MLGGPDRDLEQTSVILPDGCWTDLLSDQKFGGGEIPAQDLLRHFPVAVLAHPD
jgi:maltooligosyltrehalose synthase